MEHRKGTLVDLNTNSAQLLFGVADGGILLLLYMFTAVPSVFFRVVLDLCFT